MELAEAHYKVLQAFVALLARGVVLMEDGRVEAQIYLGVSATALDALVCGPDGQQTLKDASRLFDLEGTPIN